MIIFPFFDRDIYIYTYTTCAFYQPFESCKKLLLIFFERAHQVIVIFRFSSRFLQWLPAKKNEVNVPPQKWQRGKRSRFVGRAEDVLYNGGRGCSYLLGPIKTFTVIRNVLYDQDGRASMRLTTRFSEIEQSLYLDLLDPLPIPIPLLYQASYFNRSFFIPFIPFIPIIRLFFFFFFLSLFFLFLDL